MPLPKWLSRKQSGAYVIDADVAYPIALNAMNITQPDQYAVEAAYQCCKLKVQDIVATLDDDPRKTGGVLAIVIESKDKRRWSLESYPPGKGPDAATKGREARALIYPQIESALG